MNYRDIPPAVLPDMREFAMLGLEDLWAQLDAGTVEFLGSYTDLEFDEHDKGTGVITFSVTYRKTRKPL